jgi:hypothetical protein
MSRINETTIAFSVYEGANEYLGIAQVTMPTLTNETIQVQGAGLPGTYDSPIVGQFQPMEMSMQFRTLDSIPISFMTQGEREIELRPVNQVRALGGRPEMAAMKHVMTVQSKGLNGGTIAPKSTNDATVAFSVLRWKAFEGGRQILNIDVLNFIYEVRGVDTSMPLRVALGRN